MAKLSKEDLDSLIDTLTQMFGGDTTDKDVVDEAAADKDVVDEDKAQELEDMETAAEAEDMAELDDVDLGYDDTQNNIIASLQDRWL